MKSPATDRAYRAENRKAWRNARSGDVAAWTRVIEAIRWGHGVRKDPRRALRVAEQAWRLHSHGDIANQAAFACADMGDEPGEMAWLLRAAEAGHANCMVAVGYHLRYGLAVRRDPAAASRWYRRAARLRDPEAWMNLAICHKQGIGARKHLVAEHRCLEAAAALGSDRAKLCLAAALADGRFGTADPELAEKWFRHLAVSSASAAEELADRKLKGDGLRKDVRGALRMIRSHARRGAGWAWLQLGIEKFNGKRMRKDVNGAIRAYLRAAAAGEGRAFFNLALCHRDGTGYPKNRARALRYFEQALECGEREAATVLAARLLAGEEVPRDARRAAEILRSVITDEEPEGLVLLAQLLRDGDGVRRDLTEARWCLRIAAAQGRDVSAEMRALAAVARKRRRREASPPGAAGPRPRGRDARSRRRRARRTPTRRSPPPTPAA